MTKILSKFQIPDSRFLKRGFTIVEIMIGLGILLIIVGLGLFLSMDLYRSYAFRSEQGTVLSVLHRARTRALSNINQLPHGVHFQADKYVIFEGFTFVASASNNEDFPASGAVTHTPTSLDVVFDQLTGNTAPATIVLAGQGHTATISFNSEGKIDW